MASPARSAAESYLVCVNARDLAGLSALFAPGALLLAAGGQRLSGRDAIGGFYEQTVLPAQPDVRAVRFVEQGDTCVMELEATTPHAPGVTARMIDVVTVDAAGLIERLAIYMQLTA